MQRRQLSYAVAVTGGSGCLGQHLVKLLQTNADHVSEIRIIDRLPYTNKLGHEETKAVTSVCGDITDMDDLRRTFRGVRTVFHLCSLVSVSNFPDKKGMEKVNVIGTQQVIHACVLEDVRHLVYCSSIDVVMGYHDIVNGTEATTPIPEKLLNTDYGGSKFRAEKLIVDANGLELNGGDLLYTISLRLVPFYGELDTNYVIKTLKQAKNTGGVFIRFGSGKYLFQHAYAGNLAWAFICADKALDTNPEAAGEIYFVTDDTPVESFFSLIEPILQMRGYKNSNFKVPIWIVYCAILIFEFFLWIISPLIKIDIGYNAKSFLFVDKTVYFSSEKCRSLLKYSPLFSLEQSMDMSRKYYSKVDLKKR